MDGLFQLIELISCYKRKQKENILDLSLLTLLLFLLWISELNGPINFSEWTFSSPLTNNKFDTKFLLS